MVPEIETIKASQLVELTEVTDSNYVVVTDGATSKKVKATKLKGNSLTATQTQQLSAAYTHSQSTHVQPSDIPTKVSDLQNDSGFITAIPDEYVTETELEAKGYLTEHQDLSEYAKAVNIPTKTSNLTNDSEFITSTEMTNAISIYQTIQDENLTTTNKTIVTAINELNNMIASILDRIENLENQGGTGGGITIPVTGISLSTTTLNLIEGNSSTLTAIISPTNATNQNVVWSTNDSSVATVSNGVVTAVSAGSATITASTVDGNYTANCSITVSASTVGVTGVSLSVHSIEMSSIGETYTINYTILPANATNKNITWSSSAPTVAIIEDRLITAKGNGTAVITIRTADGGYSDTCTVKVDTSTVVSGSYVTDENGNRLMTENGSYLITE